MTDTDNQILNGCDFTHTNYSYSEPKINKSGGKSVNIQNTAAKSALVITTPLMLTWGVNEFVDDATGRKSYDMSLQFPKDEYKTDETSAFLANLIAFEQNIKTHVKDECKKLLNKSKVTDDVVDALFHPMLRYPKDQQTGEFDMTRPPTLRVKLTYWDQAFDCEIYDMQSHRLFPNENGLMPLDLISKASNAATVIRCGGLWFANGKFGVTWRLVQAVVKPRATLKGKCHIQLSSGEKSRLEQQKDDDDDDVDDEAELAEDSDDDSGGSAAAAVAPIAPPTIVAPVAVKPVAKKKVVRRVKKVTTSSAE
uniref:Uncharacterized protein n=1 Tax=viral metagenome TaxID=1070528 RepID=A0A6C0BWM8_9ZZZZ